MPSDLLGNAIVLDLRREGYRARAAFAWIPTSQFSAIATRTNEFLHAKEVETLRGLKVEKRQISYVLGRYTAKSALGICIGSGFEAAKTAITSGIFSQPVVACHQGAHPLGVSISHTDGLVCSLAYPEEHPMAIDVEELDEARTQVMLTQIGREEGDLARSVCGSNDVAATVVWTAKEALSKALRCGMTCPYELLEVCELERSKDVYSGRFKNFGQYKFQSWRRRNIVVTLVLPKRTAMELLLPESLE